MDNIGKKIKVGAGVLVCIVCAAAMFNFHGRQRVKTFDGSSDKLLETEIAATPQNEIPANANVIWCSSFQLAWNVLKDDIIKEPIRIQGNPPLAAELNAAKQSKAEISQENVYARAGFIQDGIVEMIKAEMSRQFPDEPVTLLDDIGTAPGIVGYAYLQANVPFVIPYKEENWPLQFIDSRGKQTKVTCFGLSDDAEQRDQLDILFYETNDRGEPNEFAVDLCRMSSPDQIVIARVEPKSKLSETLLYVEEKVNKYYQENNGVEFEEADELLVPNLFWKIEHVFSELLGRSLQNAGYAELPIVKAVQAIEFRLDRSGAMLKSESGLVAASQPVERPKCFVFDRPFLIYMKKRGAEQPFFMMWVDNAELLEKWRDS